MKCLCPHPEKIKINGLVHQFYFWGRPKNPKLFLFHGWLDTAAGFQFLCEYLKDRFYCIAPDFRGYGKSEHTTNPLGYFFFEYVADLHEIFKKFSPHEKVKILGHSFGGGVASFYAGIFPERVSHFINVEGFAFRNNPPERGPAKAHQWLEGLDVRPFKVFKDLDHFAHRLTQTNPRLPWVRAKFLAKHLTRRVRGGVMMSADPKHKLSEPFLFSKPNFYAFWEKIKAECLLVYAEKSEMNQWVQAADIKKEMADWFRHFPKGSKKVCLKDCGHMIHHERPEELAKVVLKFTP